MGSAGERSVVGAAGAQTHGMFHFIGKANLLKLKKTAFREARPTAQLAAVDMAENPALARPDDDPETQPAANGGVAEAERRGRRVVGAGAFSSRACGGQDGTRGC